MKVWVLMGNDFPEAVFADQIAAEAEVKRRMDEQRVGKPNWDTPRVYWRVYDFKLRRDRESKNHR
jgi:hypothetical protein